MEVNLTTIGERGQAVIPKLIREKMPAPKGTVFSVVLIDKDTIVMKKFDKKKLLAEFRSLRKSIKRGFEEGEILEEVRQSRNN